jgi:hypothetical protein
VWSVAGERRCVGECVPDVLFVEVGRSATICAGVMPLATR